MPAEALTAAVRPTPAGPVLLIDGRPAPPVMFFTNLDMAERIEVQMEEIRLAGEHGVRLVSVPITLPWPESGQEPNFAAVDARVRSVLHVHPGALLLPRTGVTWPPEFWKNAHLDELMKYDDGSLGIASVHSRLWREEAAGHLRALIEHLESQFGGSIAGYHPVGQHTGEWFYDGMWDRRLSGFEECALGPFGDFLRVKYGSDEGLRRAWHDPDASLESVELPSRRDRTRATAGSFRDPLIEQHVIDFYEFANIEMADAALRMCRAVREAAPGKLAVLFYGYHFEVSPAPFGLQTSGHLAMRRVLDSADVDIVCSPVSYLDRVPGGGGYLMAAVDSVHRAGKMWLIEDDTRTHLGTRDPVYQMQHTADLRETSGVLTRNFAHVLTRGGAVWWMDLFGRGWFADESVWALLGRLESTSQARLSSGVGYVPEVAVIVDDSGPLYAHPSPRLTGEVLGTFRRQIYRIGAPVGFYMLDDLLAGRMPAAKMYIFTDTYRLTDEQVSAVHRQVRRRGCVSVWMYGSGIIRTGSPAAANVEQLTGIHLAAASAAADGNILIERTGETFSAGHGPLAPSHAIDDQAARTLARYAAGGEVAVAARDTNGCTSVYSAVLQMPSSLLRDLCRSAGVFLYCESDDVIAAGGGFVSIAASSDGRRTLAMPSQCVLHDCITGEQLGPAQSFELTMRLGDTRLFRVLGD